ncbi:MAG: T9SS type A sorting domain-containing protein [Bacteroidota bacterium]
MKNFTKILFILSVNTLITYNSSFITYAQNLVPNPSFEDYSECPDNLGQLNRLLNWESYQNSNFTFQYSPDYYNECGIMNTFGNQNPYFGFGYTGLYTYFSDFTIIPYFYHEIINAQLIESLKINYKYYVSIKVSFAENLGLCASDKLGILFTTYNDTTKLIFNNFAHIYSDSIITDTSAWVNIYGSFIADSNYSYIHIGNFFHDSLTNISQISNCFAYYYIDDVCVSEDSLECDIPSGIKPNCNQTQSINIYPNPANNILYIENKLPDKKIKKMIIYNSQGIIEDAYYNFKDDYINIERYIKGIYFISIYSDNQIFTQKFIVN